MRDRDDFLNPRGGHEGLQFIPSQVAVPHDADDRALDALDQLRPLPAILDPFDDVADLFLGGSNGHFDDHGFAPRLPFLVRIAERGSDG